MRFGYCAPIEHAHTLASIGYDYIEPPLVSTLQPESDQSEFDQIGRLPISAEAFNIFLPGGLKVTGPDIDPQRQDKYVAAAVRRASKLGGKVIVFGSAGARSVPDSFSREKAFAQVAEFLRTAARHAHSAGITIAIEPLNKGECNFINSVAEGMQVVHDVNHPNVAVLSDLYHISVEQQPYEETHAAGARLAHVHIAGAVDRRAPIADDLDHLTIFFRTLKAMSYSGRISIEGHAHDIPTAAKIGLETMRAAWDKA